MTVRRRISSSTSAISREENAAALLARTEGERIRYIALLLGEVTHLGLPSVLAES